MNILHRMAIISGMTIALNATNLVNTQDDLASTYPNQATQNRDNNSNNHLSATDNSSDDHLDSLIDRTQDRTSENNIFSKHGLPKYKQDDIKHNPIDPEDHFYSLINWTQEKTSEKKIFHDDHLPKSTLSSFLHNPIDREQHREISNDILKNNPLTLINEKDEDIVE